jgi:hypothetical protein
MIRPRDETPPASPPTKDLTASNVGRWYRQLVFRSWSLGELIVTAGANADEAEAQRYATTCETSGA